jgi:hypothetical protein
MVANVAAVIVNKLSRMKVQVTVKVTKMVDRIATDGTSILGRLTSMADVMLFKCPFEFSLEWA